MTYNVFSGTLNPTQSVSFTSILVIYAGFLIGFPLRSCCWSFDVQAAYRYGFCHTCIWHNIVLCWAFSNITSKETNAQDCARHRNRHQWTRCMALIWWQLGCASACLVKGINHLLPLSVWSSFTDLPSSITSKHSAWAKLCVTPKVTPSMLNYQNTDNAADKFIFGRTNLTLHNSRNRPATHKLIAVVAEKKRYAQKHYIRHGYHTYLAMQGSDRLPGWGLLSGSWHMLSSSNATTGFESPKYTSGWWSPPKHVLPNIWNVTFYTSALMIKDARWHKKYQWAVKLIWTTW